MTLQPTGTTALTRQANSDAQAIGLWLHGRGPHTQRAYRSDVGRFLVFVGKPLPQVTLGDVQAFADSLDGLSPASRARTLSAVKSMLAFCHRLGYTPVDVGQAVRLPAIRGTLAARILSEGDVQRMLALEPAPRNRALLRLLYGAGLRVSELTALCWGDAQDRDGAGQITVMGKGGKTRAVLLSTDTWRELGTLRGADDAPVFPSRNGGHLDPRKSDGSSRLLPAGQESRPPSLPTGCATPTPATPSTGAALSTLCKRPWAMPQ
jgi:integrase/recombinase XerD